MLDFIKKHQVDVRFFESYLTGDQSLSVDIGHVFLKATEPVGLEIDLDCIANMPSSASSPSGFSLDDIRKVVLSLNGNQFAYVHLTEGAISQGDHERTIGRALSYLCLDAIASMESR
jgi:formiminoglutamase